MARLEIRGLRAGYGRTEVLHGVDLTVPEGSTVVLLGPNGAGKSTLLKTVAGLVGVSHGEIRFRGRAVTRAAAHARARQGICLIPEGRGIFRRLTVRENLVVHADAGAARAAVDRAAALFPILGERLDQQAGTMSGGQQQMLALARAFVTEAPLILADELSMGLAPVVVDDIFEALATLRAQGRSLLLVEQYVERAVDVADYVYILGQGTVVFAGEPAECTSGAVFARYLEGAA
ncbi:MAG TPA: ABC transporter ATP-binding protein [Acidimicrobiia bacterium]|nr:ABC transporter ATP-binding protein [Acidimicrobiia bacterium]